VKSAHQKKFQRRLESFPDALDAMLGGIGRERVPDRTKELLIVKKTK